MGQLLLLAEFKDAMLSQGRNRVLGGRDSSYERLKNKRYSKRDKTNGEKKIIKESETLRCHTAWQRHKSSGSTPMSAALMGKVVVGNRLVASLLKPKV